MTTFREGYITARRAVNRLICTAIDLGFLPDTLDPDGIFGPILTEALDKIKRTEWAPSTKYETMLTEIELTASLYDFHGVHIPRDHVGRMKWTEDVDKWLTRLAAEADNELARENQEKERQERLSRSGVPPKT